MGRARFLFYTGFIIIINRAAMGRARFLLYTGFINRAAMGRARFLLCTGFIIFFVGDQTQTSTRPNRVWGFEITQPMMFIRQKLLKHECTENVADIVFFINRAAMGRARFLLCTRGHLLLFFIFF